MFMIFLSFPVLISTNPNDVKYDDDSNAYKNDYKTLFSVYKTQKDNSIQIRDSVTTIYGESGTMNAFSECKNIVTVTFTANSALETIQRYAFYSLENLLTVNLEVCKNLATIETSAFQYCSKLKSIQFPASLKVLELDCFCDCGSLKTVKIPKSVTTLSSCFRSCSSLKTVIFEQGITLTSFVDGVFTFDGLTSFKIPASITEFCPSVIWHCNSMETIEVESNEYFVVYGGLLYTKDMLTVLYCPDNFANKTVYINPGANTIGKYAFHDCFIDEVIIPDTVTSINYEGFRWSDIKRITLPDSIKSIGNNILADCESLEYIKLSSNLTELTYEAFARTAIKTIEIPNSVTSIIGSCFIGCTSLENVTLPANITKFGGGAFSNCPKVNLTFAEGSPFSIDEQFLITRDNITVICQYIGNTPETTLTVPPTVKRILERSFCQNTFIKKIVCPEDSVLEVIENEAFKYCSIEEFIFPKTLKKIGYFSFHHANIRNVVLYSKMEELYTGYSFHECQYLENVTFAMPVKNLVFARNSFSSTPSLVTVNLPEGLVSMGEECFANCEKLESIVLPSTLKTIGVACFVITNLTTVTFNTVDSAGKALTPSLTTIGGRAFNNVRNLVSFPFTEGIEYIGERAFATTLLTNVTLPTTIKNISDKCFCECPNLESVVAKEPSNLQFIGNFVFQHSLNMRSAVCNNAHFITENGGLYNYEKSRIIFFPPKSPVEFLCLPEQVTMISPGTFTSCSNIKLILMPDDSKLDFIGAEAFLNCVHLISINMPKTVTTVGADAFKDCRDLTCDLVIDAEKQGFKDELVTIGKMPEKCVNPCQNKCDKLIYNMQESISTYKFAFFVFILYTIE